MPLLVVVTIAALVSASGATGRGVTYRIDHVTDGDTVVLRNGQPCPTRSGRHPRGLLRDGVLRRAGIACNEAAATGRDSVRLFAEPATDRIDGFGRVLAYVVRAHDGVDVNIRPVAIGAAAPYFYKGRRGKYAKPARGARETGEGEASRPVGDVSAHVVRPVPRHRDAPLCAFRRSSRYASVAGSGTW